MMNLKKMPKKITVVSCQPIQWLASKLKNMVSSLENAKNGKK